MKHLVIADDFTGAAEIAGLAHRAGRSVALLTECPQDEGLPEAEVVVLDTDSRLLSSDQARQRLGSLGRRIDSWKPDAIFKKIDSVLRGPVLAEIEALLDQNVGERAVIASANPSRGRIIREGRYYINDVPLHLTEFARDAFHPARCSEVEGLIGTSPRVEIPNLETQDDLNGILESLGEDVLPVGGADFYIAYEKIAPYRKETAWRPEAGPILWICGSRSNGAGREKLQDSDRTEVVCCDPEVEAKRWIKVAIQVFREGKDCALTLPEARFLEPDQLLSFFAGIGAEVVASRLPRAVYVEGGATARALVNRLGLSRFTVEGDVAQGIVAVRPQGDSSHLVFVVKPGSYPWPAGLIA